MGSLDLMKLKSRLKCVIISFKYSGSNILRYISGKYVESNFPLNLFAI